MPYDPSLPYIYGPGQPYTYTVNIQYFGQGNHQMYGHIRRIHTILANTTHSPVCTARTWPPPPKTRATPWTQTGAGEGDPHLRCPLLLHLENPQS